MKFKRAVVLSVIFHISLFALAFYGPAWPMAPKKGETVYYVDFFQVPGGGAGDGKPAGGSPAGPAGQTSTGGLKDLTVREEATAVPDSGLSYPDKSKKEQKETKKADKKKKEEDKLISVVRKETGRTPAQPGATRTGTGNVSDSSIRIGTGTGSGTGPGTGTGSGFGDGWGDGGPGGNFPYAYYIDTLKNKVSNSWYKSLASPGLRGKFVAIVCFKIMRNGRVDEVKLEQTSGISALDLSAQRAVRDASPFPPLPYDFPYSYLGVHFEFAWEK